LKDSIHKDPIYLEATRAAQDRGSLLSEQKLANLYLIIRYAISHGDIFEFGSYGGGSAVFIATLLKGLGRSNKILAFDTFEGMPFVDTVRDLHSAGDFADAKLDGLMTYIEKKQLHNHIQIVQGRFDQTLPDILAGSNRPSLLHVDCDLYEPVKYCIRSCLPYLNSGSYIVLDDPLHGSCIGAFDAVQELLIRELGLYAEQTYPHLVYRFPALVNSA
jgi:Macrocin-O-methyltransferase (TylF)